MKRERGFTLIELVVVIAIVGILSATALPFYNTYRMRTYGSEAKVMIKQILEAEVAYYVNNDDFFPSNLGDWIEVYHDGTALFNGAASATVIQDVADALKIIIPVGHNLDFVIRRAVDGNGMDAVWVTISSYNNSFPLHGGGTSITGIMNKDGQRLVF